MNILNVWLFTVFIETQQNKDPEKNSITFIVGLVFILWDGLLFMQSIEYEYRSVILSI